MDSDTEDCLVYNGHGIGSDSESDNSGGKSDFDDEYEAYKSPPLQLDNGEYNIIEIEPFENVKNKKQGKKLQAKLSAHCLPNKMCKKSNETLKNAPTKTKNSKQLNATKTSTSKKNAHEKNKCSSLSSNVPTCALKLRAVSNSRSFTSSSSVNQNYSYSAVVKSCKTMINSKLLAADDNLNRNKAVETQQVKKLLAADDNSNKDETVGNQQVKKKKKRKKKSAANLNEKQVVGTAAKNIDNKNLATAKNFSTIIGNEKSNSAESIYTSQKKLLDNILNVDKRNNTVCDVNCVNKPQLENNSKQVYSTSYNVKAVASTSKADAITNNILQADVWTDIDEYDSKIVDEQAPRCFNKVLNEERDIHEIGNSLQKINISCKTEDLSANNNCIDWYFPLTKNVTVENKIKTHKRLPTKSILMDQDIKPVKHIGLCAKIPNNKPSVMHNSINESKKKSKSSREKGATEKQKKGKITVLATKNNIAKMNKKQSLKSEALNGTKNVQIANCNALPHLQNVNQGTHITPIKPKKRNRNTNKNQYLNNVNNGNTVPIVDLSRGPAVEVLKKQRKNPRKSKKLKDNEVTNIIHNNNNVQSSVIKNTKKVDVKSSKKGSSDTAVNKIKKCRTQTAKRNNGLGKSIDGNDLWYESSAWFDEFLDLDNEFVYTKSLPLVPTNNPCDITVKKRKRRRRKAKKQSEDGKLDDSVNVNDLWHEMCIAQRNDFRDPDNEITHNLSLPLVKINDSCGAVIKKPKRHRRRKPKKNIKNDCMTNVNNSWCDNDDTLFLYDNFSSPFFNHSFDLLHIHDNKSLSTINVDESSYDYTGTVDSVSNINYSREIQQRNEAQKTYFSKLYDDSIAGEYDDLDFSSHGNLTFSSDNSKYEDSSVLIENGVAKKKLHAMNLQEINQPCTSSSLQIPPENRHL